ncbi:unnamed protein product [Phytomonas sp. EM1]|nr:unnamed protein product [Phytomonas sp. EM1]|eukprot:CCW63890.1 unnamed protein product [Phytomonas sp. isolate EM1]
MFTSFPQISLDFFLASALPLTYLLNYRLFTAEAIAKKPTLEDKSPLLIFSLIHKKNLTFSCFGFDFQPLFFFVFAWLFSLKNTRILSTFYRISLYI